jgi:hypothetical protein
VASNGLGSSRIYVVRFILHDILGLCNLRDDHVCKRVRNRPWVKQLDIMIWNLLPSMCVSRVQFQAPDVVYQRIKYYNRAHRDATCMALVPFGKKDINAVNHK